MNTKTILLVDDSDDVRQVVAMNLCDRGYIVCQARNGSEALDMLQGTRSPSPDLIVSDYDMPLMNGEEFCRACLADANLAKIPFILSSAHTEVHKFASSLGVHAYSKCDSPRKLFELVDRLVGDKR